MDNIIPLFTRGVYNLLPNEVIPEDAAQDALGFATQEGREKLVGGRVLLGTEGLQGMVRGLWFGYTVAGVKVLYRKTETALQVYNTTTLAWDNVLTSLTSGTEGSFANYSSLAGAFTFFVTDDGYWKINNANPTSAIQMYDSTKNFHGRILIDKGRTLLWRRKDANTKDYTALYGSHIDPQTGSYYTTVTAEAIGLSGSTAYAGTLAFKAGDAHRNALGVQITATVGAGTELFTDNFDGTLTSNFGGTGTINYATGAYSVTFSAVTTGAVTGNYQWENSNSGGVTDFTKSSTRAAGEGFQIPQDAGGDAIQKVLIGQDGAYYSLKKERAYRFAMDDTDLSPTNEIYYENMGIPSENAAVSTKAGIVFINTANPDKPEMTILERNPVGDTILPRVLFEHFRFANYDFSDSYFDTYERYVVISCMRSSAETNDRILLCNVSANTVNISPYEARMFAKDSAANLYVGSSVSQSVYQIYNGADDLGDAINAYFISAADRYFFRNIKLEKSKRNPSWRSISENLKKFRKLRITGLIGISQVVPVYLQLDDGSFQQIGTIRGDGTYVDQSSPQVIGSNVIGDSQIGGGTTLTAYPYFWEIKVRITKFRKRAVKIEPTGIGYFDFAFLSDVDVLVFENRLPAKYRQKQNVSLDGTETDQPLT